jgi:hypothetical protein
MTKAFYHGVWMMRSAPLAYRVMPKCGCSSIGQVMHLLDHGAFHPGSIHDPDAGLLKWREEGAPDNDEIQARYATGAVRTFTLVRNPWRRLLSSYADKIVGLQAGGTLYRGGLMHAGMARYGAVFDGDPDLVANFHAFVRFVADGFERDLWSQKDWHWQRCALHLRYTLVHNPDLDIDFIGHVETLRPDLEQAFALGGVPASALPADIPRENATVLPPHPIETFFGPEEREIVRRVYADDFALFRYPLDPGDTRPTGPVDTRAVVRALRGPVETPARGARTPDAEAETARLSAGRD